MRADRPSSRGSDRAADRVALGARSVNYATSPLLAAKTPPGRSRLIVAMVALAFLVLIGRAFYIQVVNADFFQMQGERRFAHTLKLQASRGNILDRNGALLAGSVPAPSIWMIPRDFQATPQQRQALARLLRLRPEDLQDRIEAGGRFAWLRRQVDDDVAAAVMKLGIKGVHQVQEYRRKYPEGEAAAHVVGFTDIDDRGKEGIELGFDTALQGRDGSRFVVKDRLGRMVEDITDQTDPVHGRDIILSVDSKVQFFAWQKLREAVQQHGARAGSAVVLDVKRGEVLALANYPSYNPADRSRLTGASLRNRAITDIFEPGSTMKPFIAALAIDRGRVTADTIIPTAPGRIQITGATISDVHPHGDLTVTGVIQKSSNVGTVKLAMQMPASEMWGLFNGIGLGQRPQIDFPGAVTGRLRPHKTWRPVEQATMSYGYGLSASLLQLARAYTVFASDGELIPMSIIRRDFGDGEATARMQGERVLSPRTAQQVREMLRLAAAPGGTAPKAQTVGYSVGGKTGTARKLEGRQYTTKYRSWFVGLAPVSDPRIVVAVMVDEPSKGVFYGGEVAAPVFSQVVQQTLRLMQVAPDIEVTPQIISVPQPAELESY
jgi:cell division protein FtsI (penicillin-binding protein 3)